jgi:NAD(P)-dependent dehydrogenase (short-subunit alcohol dehydrogenase family)
MSAPHPFGLTGKHVLVTGAGGGLGRAIVAAFVAAGALVSGADRDPSQLADLPLHHRLAFDITDAAACRAAIADLAAAGATPDVLVNNAGASRADSLAALDAGVWAAELATNLTGAYNVTAPVTALWERGGVIVFTSSVNALTHYGNPAYAAAKAGLVAYSRALAVELGSRGVRSNVVAPGSVRTAAWDHREPKVLEDAARYYPIGRILAPEDVANTIVFLASPLAAGISGAVVPVDGGLMAGNVPFVRDIIGSDI